MLMPTSKEIATVHTDAFRLGALVLIAAAAVILTALGFEHIGGYIPCPLCLQQRYAYYAGIPLVGLALVFLGGGRQQAAALTLMIVGFLFIANAGIGSYQAGAEWGFWPGPQTCGTVEQLPTNASDLLKGIADSRIARCDEASWRFLGLSFAGWNVVMSLLLAAGALRAAYVSDHDDT
jgi:disulfide bond formation protein DsbB